MSLRLQLDDRSYEDLLAEARGLVPAHAPTWTDHNPTDPGIVLLELFAWLAEMLIYRADQVPDRHVLVFLRLLRGPDWNPPPGLSTADHVSAALAELREPWRAVTPRDYERIAAATAPAAIARVRCAPRRDLTPNVPNADAPGVVSVVVLPVLAPTAQIVGTSATNDVTPDAALLVDLDTSLWIGAASPFGGVRIALSRPGAGYDLRVAYFDGTQFRAFVPEDGTAGLTRSGTIAFAPSPRWAVRAGDDPPRFWLRLTTATTPSRRATARRVAAVMAQPGEALLGAVRDRLEPRRILTTRPVVVGPAFVAVGCDVLVARQRESDEAALRAEIARRIDAFLDPVSGGPDGAGWPLGRHVYVSELHELIDAVPGVDHVPDVLPTLAGAAPNWLLHPDGDVVGVPIGANRLPDARVDESRVVCGVAFVSVYVTLELTVSAGAEPVALRAAAKRAVRDFFHPLTGGPTGGAARNWPVADIEAKVRAADRAVSAVKARLRSVPDRMTPDSTGLPVVALREGEFVDVSTEITLS